MEDTFTSNSKQDLTTKTRKPYTITKQRERWTSEEHNRFLEAIKLYGRAWQRIEEHIGTKTAVQIRSHAQKFFSKLEKEAVTKGAPLGQERDIDIPPPRPKRKPNNPYPRKNSAGIVSSSSLDVKDENFLKSASFLHSEQVQDVENKSHHEKPFKRTRAKENFDEDSEISTLTHKTPCTSYSLASKSSASSAVPNVQSVFGDFRSSVKRPGDENTIDEFPNNDSEGIKKPNRTDGNYTNVDDEMCRNPNMNYGLHNLEKEVTKEVKLKQPENLCLLPKEDIKFNQNFPRHIPVHVVESSSKTCTESLPLSTPCPVSVIHQSEETSRNAKVLTNPVSSGFTEMHNNIFTQESLSKFHSLLKLHSSTEDSCNMSVNTTISNLIVSTLLQNPAAHAAASFVASFWPFTNVKSQVDSPLGISEGFQSGHSGLTPTASAIAAATVMAASAWWATHGLLPLCSPVHATFTSTHMPSNPSASNASPVLVMNERMDPNFKLPPGKGQQQDSGVSMNLDPRLPDNAFPPPCSTDYSKNGSVRSNMTEVETSGQQNSVPIAGLKESHKEKAKELVDRSSCGSNTPSSSEVEMDLLEKQTNGNGKDEPEEHNENHRPSSEPNNHRARSMGNTNESWKEVSEEGKLAFKALFAREVLPQSFSPPKCLGNNKEPTNGEEDGIHELDEKCGDKLQLDLNSNTLSISVDGQETEKNEDIQNGCLLIGGGHGKLRFRRTGFKPYKRCSVEAEKRSVMNDVSNQGEQRDPKRLCLEGEASV